MMREELRQYAAMLGFPDSETLAKIFAILFDDEESIKIVQALPGTVPNIAKHTGLTLEKVQQIVDKLKNRGAINLMLRKNNTFRLFPAMIELRDATAINPECPQKLFELWDTMINEEVPQLISHLKAFKIPPMVRVIPVEEKVEAKSSILDIDSAKKIFNNAALITALPCACRTQTQRVGKRTNCPAPAINLCMQTNGFAEAVLDRGLGERLTHAEALKRIGLAEDAGLVHVVRNNMKEDMFMCNCCSCCCVGLGFINKFDYPGGFAPSRFRVTLNPELCTGCGLCVDRCQFKAIKEEKEIVSIALEKCYGCGNCAMTCPNEALALEEIRPKEFVRIT